MNVGFVGYFDESKYDENRYKHFIDVSFQNLYSCFPNKKFRIVAGLTNIGISKLVYEKAQSLNLETIGFACKKAKNYPLFDVDETHICGENWGDESIQFINYIDCLVRIAGGNQSFKEVDIAKKNGKLYIFEYDML